MKALHTFDLNPIRPSVHLADLQSPYLDSVPLADYLRWSNPMTPCYHHHLRSCIRYTHADKTKDVLGIHLSLLTWWVRNANSYRTYLNEVEWQIRAPTQYGLWTNSLICCKSFSVEDLDIGIDPNWVFAIILKYITFLHKELPKTLIAMVVIIRILVMDKRSENPASTIGNSRRAKQRQAWLQNNKQIEDSKS